MVCAAVRLKLLWIRTSVAVLVLTDRRTDLGGGGVLIHHFLLVELLSLSHSFDDGSELIVRVPVNDDG